MNDVMNIAEPIRRLDSAHPDFQAQLDSLIRYEPGEDRRIIAVVSDIIADVRARGDEALLAYTRRFDRLEIADATSLQIPGAELRGAFQDLPAEQAEALKTAAARVRAFHEHQAGTSWTYTEPDGTRLGQRINALDRVGLYVPGGKAAYPSSVLMNALPAQVAGVGRLTMVVPTPDGIRNPLVLAAAHVAGIQAVYTVGGAQAVAALAFGTRTIAAVDKITGPGNAYVAEAKRQVFGVVGIDMIAGPSEILVVSDGSVDPDWVAMDMFSQAEHDELAQAILLCPDDAFIDRVRASIARLLPSQPRSATIARSLADRGALIRVADMAQACSIASRIAPEHLEILAKDADSYVDAIHHAGAIFIGPYSSEALGDYCAGPNHVLPTMRTSRFSSPLGVYDFQKRSSLIEVSAQGAQRLGPTAATLADAEGLAAHAQSARLRLDTRVSALSALAAGSAGAVPASASTPSRADTDAGQVVLRAIAPAVRRMHAYPVPESAGFLKLDAMENPYTLPDDLRVKFGARLAALDINRYPRPGYTALKAAIAQTMGVPEGYPVVVGNGSDELISMLNLATRGCGPVLAPTPTFVMYEIGSALVGSRFIGVDLDEDFQLRPEAMLAAIDEHSPALVYLAWPNNPTGACFDEQAVQAIVERAPGLVVIDEAYQPFAQRSWMSRLPTAPNLVLMRTVSKIGLAGIRIGYLAADPAITAELEKVRPPYNISVLDEAAALFALEHHALLGEQAARLREARPVMAQALAALPGVQVFESATNFLLARFADGNRVHRALHERSIMVRNVGAMHPLLRNCLRLTISTPQENALLLDALRDILTD